MKSLTSKLDQPGPKGLDDLGGAWDRSIQAEIERFARSDEQGKAAWRACVDRGRSWVLVGWAERMASLAVRDRDRRHIVVGLIGLALHDPKTIDERDALLVYPLLIRAAELVLVEPRAVVNEAARDADLAGREWLLERLRHPEPQIPPTHGERGHAGTFAFERRETGDPLVELADLLDGE